MKWDTVGVSPPLSLMVVPWMDHHRHISHNHIINLIRPSALTKVSGWAMMTA